MKKTLILTLTISLFAARPHAQIVIEHLYEVSKTYNPLFGKEKGSLSLTMEMTYREGGDSILSLVIDINQLKAKIEGTINSVSVAGASYNGYWGVIGALASSFSSTKAYSFRNTQGVAILDYNSFDSLFNILGKLRVLSNQSSIYNKTVLYKVNKIILGLDIKNEKGSGKMVTEKSYYFQIDESTFKLSESEFKDLSENSLEPLKQSFDEFKRNRLIVVPIK